MEFTDEEGEVLVRLAREAVEKYLRESIVIAPPKDLEAKFYREMGVFVTLNSVLPEGCELRGCIGHPLPEMPLVEAVIDAAISSAVHDPRFERVTADEMDKIVVEVSVLTPPERIAVVSPKEYPTCIKVGEDGLIMKWRFGSGLLLPQVAVEYGWSPEDFLCHTCMKAGATPDQWLAQDTEIYKFRAVVFDEVSPRGRVMHRSRK